MIVYMLVSAYIFLFTALRLPIIQKKLVHAVAAYLSKELNTEISINSFRFEPFDKIVIRGIYVADQDNDTLLFARTVKLNFASLNRSTNFLRIRTIEITDAVTHLVRYEGSGEMNFDFIRDYFAPASEANRTERKWKVSANNISFINCSVSYKDLGADNPSVGINLHDLEVSRLFASFKKVSATEDSLSFNLSSLSFIEKSGFTIQELSSSMIKLIHDSLTLQSLAILTPQTHILGDLAFGFSSLKDFGDFINKINLRSEFRNSEIHSSDLAYFIPELTGLESSVGLSGQIRGTIANLRLRDFFFKYGNATEFKGKIDLIGLPDIDETFIDLKVDNLNTSSSDLASIQLPPYDSLNYLRLPPAVQRLGKINFKGKFTGFYNDFVTYGNIKTDLGYLATDLNLKFKGTPVYSGRLSSTDFQLGKFAASENLGLISLSAEVNGSYFDINKINAEVKGEIDRFDFRGYSYSEIEIGANISKRLFNGFLNVNDPNLDLNFSGNIDFTHKIPKFDFIAGLNHANLSNLNFSHHDSLTTLSFESAINMTGGNLDEFQGSLNLSKITYRAGNQQFKIDSVKLASSIDQQNKRITLESDAITAKVNGQFNNTTIYPAFLNMLQMHFPVSFLTYTLAHNKQDFSYIIITRQTQSVFNIFAPGLSIAPGTVISGNFSSITNDFSLSLESDQVTYQNIAINNLSFTGTTSDSAFKYLLKADHSSVRDSLVFNSLEINGYSTFEQAILNLNVQGRDSLLDKIKISSEIAFEKSGSPVLSFLSSDLLIDGQYWMIPTGNRIQLDSTGASIHDFRLVSGNEIIAFNGFAGSKPNDVLNVFFSSFPIQPLNKILSTYGITSGGFIDGELKLFSLLANPMASSDLLIRDFSLFGDTLGTANFLVHYSSGEKKISAEADIMRQDIKNLILKGEYNIKSDKLDFSAELNKMNVTPFGHYLNSFASQVRGFASGEISLTGTTSKPSLRGKVRLQKAAMTIDYLNCRYSFSDEVTITPGAFSFNNITISDELGNTALLSGNIAHRNFNDFSLYLSIRTKNLQTLNTNPHQNNLFYGTGFVSGQVVISGPFELISFNGSIRSEAGTEISIPLSNPEEVTQSSFIQFITRDSTVKTFETDKIDLSGINMRLDVNITENALIKLIYDEKIGDKMEGRGTGNIVFEITTDEVFTMRGDYTATSGNYVFTLQNIINKRFYIQNGGTIRWNGSPYEAIINIDAIYRTRASLYDLLADTSSAGRKRIPVIINLSLRNQLLKPDISFSIDIPDIDPTMKGLVQQAISTEESKNKQTLSLLVLNRFLPGDNRSTDFEASSSGLSANASELLSVQLTNWVSQLTDKVDVGINYRAGDKLNSDQLEVMLGTRLFNDRVAVETNLGFNSNNTNASGQNNSNIVGDFNVDVKLTDDGKFHFKAFNRANNINFLTNFNSLYTQGIGFYYKQEFNTLKDIFTKRKEE
ncbi:MAG: translocation/assembly module TamB domain-containing protein [Bacteroidia bacterium]|nr:translocation/assembly module TamB domain-containing protein [Bacteroidia bacterium]